MKKLKLSLQNIEGAEVLSREQLKKVMGGETVPPNHQCSSQSECPSPTICCPGINPPGQDPVRYCLYPQYAVIIPGQPGVPMCPVSPW